MVFPRKEACQSDALRHLEGRDGRMRRDHCCQACRTCIPRLNAGLQEQRTGDAADRRAGQTIVAASPSHKALTRGLLSCSQVGEGNKHRALRLGSSLRLFLLDSCISADQGVVT